MLQIIMQEEIYSSSYAAAAYLHSIDFPKDKKVYVVGQEGIAVGVISGIQWKPGVSGQDDYLAQVYANGDAGGA